MLQYFLKQIAPHPIIIFLDKDVTIVGRKTIESLANYLKVSKYHAAFTYIDRCWHLKDLDSLNNLYLNFQKVNKDELIKLHIGDIIGFGTSSFDTNTKNASSDNKGFLCVLTVNNQVKEEPNCSLLPEVETAEYSKCEPITKIPTFENCEESCLNHLPNSIDTLSKGQIQQHIKNEFPVITVKENVDCNIVETTSNVLYNAFQFSNVSKQSCTDNEIKYIDQVLPNKNLQKDTYEQNQHTLTDVKPITNNGTPPALMFCVESNSHTSFPAKHSLTESKCTLSNETLRIDNSLANKTYLHNRKLYIPGHKKSVTTTPHEKEHTLSEDLSMTSATAACDSVNDVDMCKSSIQIDESPEKDKYTLQCRNGSFSVVQQQEANDTEMSENSLMVTHNASVFPKSEPFPDLISCVNVTDNQLKERNKTNNQMKCKNIPNDNLHGLCATSKILCNDVISGIECYNNTSQTSHILFAEPDLKSNDKSTKNRISINNDGVDENINIEDTGYKTTYQNYKIFDVIYEKHSNRESCITNESKKNVLRDTENVNHMDLNLKCNLESSFSRSLITDSNTHQNNVILKDSNVTPTIIDKKDNILLSYTKAGVNSLYLGRNENIIDPLNLKSSFICYVKVVKCDSRHFVCPSNVRKINWGRIKSLTKKIQYTKTNFCKQKKSNLNKLKFTYFYHKKYSKYNLKNKNKIGHSDSAVQEPNREKIPLISDIFNFSETDSNDSEPDFEEYEISPSPHILETIMLNKSLNKEVPGRSENISLKPVHSGNCKRKLNSNPCLILKSKKCSDTMLFTEPKPKKLCTPTENVVLEPSIENVNTTIVDVIDDILYSCSYENLQCFSACETTNISTNILQSTPRFKCYIEVVKCDSPHFVCPPSVKKINWGKLHFKMNNIESTKLNLNKKKLLRNQKSKPNFKQSNIFFDKPLQTQDEVSVQPEMKSADSSEKEQIMNYTVIENTVQNNIAEPCYKIICRSNEMANANSIDVPIRDEQDKKHLVHKADLSSTCNLESTYFDYQKPCHGAHEENMSMEIPNHNNVSAFHDNLFAYSVDHLHSLCLCSKEDTNFVQSHLQSCFTCYVEVVKCDSSHFVCPSNVKKINWGKLRIKMENIVSTKTNLNNLSKSSFCDKKLSFSEITTKIDLNEGNQISHFQTSIQKSQNKNSLPRKEYCKNSETFKIHQNETNISPHSVKAFGQKGSIDNELTEKVANLTLKTIRSKNSKRIKKMVKNISLKCKKQTKGKILFTEPKPMTIRPQSVREEGFIRSLSGDRSSNFFQSKEKNMQSKVYNQPKESLTDSISSNKTLKTIHDKLEQFNEDSFGTDVKNVEACNKFLEIPAAKRHDLCNKRYASAASKRPVDYGSRSKSLMDFVGPEYGIQYTNDSHCDDMKKCGNSQDSAKSIITNVTSESGIDFANLSGSSKSLHETFPNKTTHPLETQRAFYTLNSIAEMRDEETYVGETHNLELVDLENNEKTDVICHGESLIPHAMKVKHTSIINSKLSASKRSENVAVVSPFTKSIHEKIDKSRIKRLECDLTHDALIEVIVGWNPKWLHQQIVNQKPPPVISEEAVTIPHSFASYKEYVSSLYPLIVIDIWCKLFEKFELLKETNSWNKFHFSIISQEDKAAVTELTCQSLIAYDSPYLPCDGNVVLLNIKQNEHSFNSFVFGYIKSHKFMMMEQKTIPSEWSVISKIGKGKVSLWTYKVVVKRRKISYRFRIVLLGHGVCNIDNNFQQIDAVCYLQSSPLLNNILHPRENSFKQTISNKHLLPTTYYMEQCKIVDELFDDIIQSKSQSNIILVSGPSGTGKTSVIVKLISKLINGDYTQRILITASSENELDQIGCQLLSVKEFHSQLIKLVKLDHRTENTCSLLQSYTLQSLTTSYGKFHDQRNLNAMQEKINLLGTSINDAFFLNNDQRTNFLPANEITEYLNNLISQHALTKDQKMPLSNELNLEWTHKLSVLSECNVFLSTPENLSGYSAFFNDLGPFSCCLVENAARCTELEVLRCLTSQVNKLILFADPLQSPPFPDKSFLAKYGYYRSLFRRFYDCFKNYSLRNPPLTFETQFRMHSDICSFVSTFFYDSQIKTHHFLNRKYKSFPLKPYLVLNIIEEQTGNCADEVVALSALCLNIRQMAPDASVGIISPTPEQTAMYHQILFGSDICKDVDIDHAEAYLGREKDVIVISGIRSLAVEDCPLIKSEQHLYLALTRAKQCLILIGNFSSYKPYHWKCLLNDAKKRNVLRTIGLLKHCPLLIKKFLCR